jgi:SAM-dependent methyltransferase
MTEACPACGSPGLVPWRRATASDPDLAGAESFPLARCPACGTAVTGGPPATPALYEGGTYTPARGMLSALIEPLRRLAERDRMRFLRGLPAGADVLELGAGDGRFVARMRAAGLDAWGIEPSAAGRSAAAAIGARLEPGTVESAELESGTLDAVVLWHSLEHVADPADSVRRVRPWLRAGGRLVVAVPNLAGLQARLGDDRWFHQDVPRHRTHFTANGIVALVERNGFRLRRLSQVLIEQNPLGMWQTLLNRLCAERDFAFRLLKRDLGGVPAPRRARDLVVTALAGPVLAPVAVVVELAAGLAGRGGSVVVEAEANP